MVFNVQEVSWCDVRDEVNLVNSELANICDQINPDKTFFLYKIRYPYGAKIVDKGCFNLPTTTGEVVPLTDTRVPLKFKEQLSYCHIPLSLILHNDNEVFVEASNRIIPLNFFHRGDLFGIFESVASLVGDVLKPRWSVTAGARSVFMLPKISDKIAHGRLKKELGIHCEAPAGLNEQWHVFTQITQAKKSPVLWYNEILVFGKSWLAYEYSNASWFKFQQYLYKVHQRQLKLFMNHNDFGVMWRIWEEFNEIIAKQGLRPRLYIVDTIKHLVSIASGSGVAFSPAVNESAMPVAFIQEAYVNVYNLKTYVPVLMQPCKLDSEVMQNLYYSLSHPTTLESSPITRHTSSIIEDQRQVRMLTNTLLKIFDNQNSNIISNKIKFAYFHSDFDKYAEIQDSINIALSDSQFTESLFKGHNNNAFCPTASFFRGCVRISIN